MEIRDQIRGESQNMDELAELIAWRGYEFWSAQIEAEMEFTADLDRAAMISADQFEAREGKSDVLPF